MAAHRIPKCAYSQPAFGLFDLEAVYLPLEVSDLRFHCGAHGALTC